MWPQLAPSITGANGHVLAQSSEGAETGFLSAIEDAINAIFNPLTEALSNVIFAEIPIFGVGVPWIVVWLIAAAAIFTIAFGFIQFRSVGLSLKLVRGKYSKPDDPGEITHFQALASALSGTVGMGNIAGVGVAVTVGGAGATFWMIIAGLLGMCTKFVECTLGVRYRTIHEDGTVSGGPMQYLSKGIAERFPSKGGRSFGKILAVLAAIMILFFGVAGGNMLQANQTFAQLRTVTGGDDGFLGGDGAALLFGITLAFIIGLVIVGGIKSIAQVTRILVPFMAVIYVAACLFVIGTNYDLVPAAFGEIVAGAFSPEAGLGGVLGVLVVGFQRSAFSNEAGIGSAPIAHSAVKTRYPATEGLVALIEPFIDTVIVCTMTALTVVIAQSQFWQDAKASIIAGGDEPEGITVVSASFETFLPWFPVVLAVAASLFAISTILTWGYYGQRAWVYMFGKNRVSIGCYNAFFSLFVITGSVLTLGSVLDFADAVLFALAFVNIIGLYLLFPVVRKEIKRLRDAIKSGDLYRTDLPSQKAEKVED